MITCPKVNRLQAPAEQAVFPPAPGQRPCHIHLRAQGSLNHRYALLFRDYLRAHDSARLTVDQIKRELARLHGGDEDAYYALKDPVYDLVWLAAGAWAARTNWHAESASDD